MYVIIMGHVVNYPYAHSHIVLVVVVYVLA